MDQEQLWSLGAVPMLKSLTNSKHKTISTCSLAALKNLYAASTTASQVRKNPSNIRGVRKKSGLASELITRVVEELE